MLQVRADTALVLHMAGSHFLVCSGRDQAPTPLLRHLHIGPFSPNQVLDSYSASLLARLQRLHRALHHQLRSNEQAREALERRGLCASRARFESFPAAASKGRATSGKALFFDRAKEPETRMTEGELRDQVEQVR